MKIHFYLRFSTRFGQSLSISGDTKALGNNDIRHALPLTYLNNEFWKAEVEVDQQEAVKIHYQYVFFHEDGTVVPEWNDRKQIDISRSGVDEIEVFDTWCDTGSFENAFYTDAFQEVLLDENRTHFKLKSPKSFTHISFSVDNLNLTTCS